MSNQIETSFIPQQPILKTDNRFRRHERLNLAFIISTVIFFATLLAGAGVYFYKQSIEKRITRLSDELSGLENTLSIDTIAKYKKIDARIISANKLLSNHAIFSTVLDVIEKTTADNIGLTGLTFDNETGTPHVGLTGIASSYAALYFQIESWQKKTEEIRLVQLDSVSLNESSGNVSFSVHITLSPALTKYPALLKAQKEKALSSEATIAPGSDIINSNPAI